MSRWIGPRVNIHGVRYQWGTYQRTPEVGFHLGAIMRDTGVIRECCCEIKAKAMADTGCVNDVCPRCGQSVAVQGYNPKVCWGEACQPTVIEVWED